MPHLLDPYARHHSPIHRLPAWIKLGAAVGLVLLVLAIPPAHARWLLAVAAALLVLAAMSRVPPAFLLRRLLLVEPLALGVALLALLGPGGWRMALLLLTRSTLCLFAMLLLSNTTPFSQLLAVLRRLRVPALLITTLALMYRYLWVLLDESHRMKRARQSRTFTASRRRTWKALASVAGRLFIRASERGERIYAAMCARGWK